MTRLNHSIDWDTTAENLGFSSPKEMLQYYMIRLGTFKGVAMELGVNINTLKRLRIFLGVHSFKPMDYYAWTKHYTSMHSLVEHKMKEGWGSRRITNFIDGYVSRETIKLLMRKIQNII